MSKLFEVEEEEEVIDREGGKEKSKRKGYAIGGWPEKGRMIGRQKTRSSYEPRGKKNAGNTQSLCNVTETIFL